MSPRIICVLDCGEAADNNPVITCPKCISREDWGSQMSKKVAYFAGWLFSLVDNLSMTEKLHHSS